MARKKVRPERIAFPICIREIVISVERLSTGGVKVERETQVCLRAEGMEEYRSRSSCIIPDKES